MSREQHTEYQGIVFKKATGTYWVNYRGEVVVCSLSNRLRKQLIYPIADRSSIGHHRVIAVDDVAIVDPVAVGDEVRFVDADNDEGMIMDVLPRRSKLTRKAAGAKPLEQVIVANVDQVLTVFASSNPMPKWTLLDRYLASAEASEVEAVICFTKTDLLNRKQSRKLEDMAELYRSIGYNVIMTSSLNRSGLDDLRNVLENKVSALVGMSGMGKSSLLNALQPGLGLMVKEINSKLHKGRHATTNVEMYQFDFGGAVIDTPGIKVFSLWNVEEPDLGLYFREMRPYIGACKFGLSCTHDHEPSCAIKAAVETGTISESRYASYLYIRQYLHAEDK